MVDYDRGISFVRGMWEYKKTFVLNNGNSMLNGLKRLGYVNNKKELLDKCSSFLEKHPELKNNEVFKNGKKWKNMTTRDLVSVFGQLIIEEILENDR